MTNLNEQKLDLRVVKRFTGELNKALADIAELKNIVLPHVSNDEITSANPADFDASAHLTWLFACLLGLAKRGLLPANLIGRGKHNTNITAAIQCLSKSVFGLSDVELDTSDLAISVGEIITDIGKEFDATVIDNGLQLTQKVCAKAAKRDEVAISSTTADPLFPAWVYQYLLHRQEKNWKKNFKISTRSNTSEDLYTQWFTPSWIAEFLVEESITASRKTFLDPACGAGQILVPAIQRTIDLQIKHGVSLEEALKTALSEYVYGLEIDPDLTAASTISMYLTCRDIHRIAELPKANVFTVVDDISDGELSRSVGGSLRVGISQLKTSTMLLRADEFILFQKSKTGKDREKFSTSRLPEKFAALAANPPYMSMRNMPSATADLLKQHYPQSKNDLYAAFIELSVGLLQSDARASIICQQSVLSISRYEKLRLLIKQNCEMETVVQLGSGSFPTKPGEKVNNAIITLRRKTSDLEKKEKLLFSFARILYSEEKRQAERQGIKSLLDSQTVNTNRFANPEIGVKTEFAPWCPQQIQGIFEAHPPLQSNDAKTIVVNGLFTCNNRLFVKKYDEVAAEARHEYVPYDKGGGQKWYHSTPYLLHWVRNGDEIRDYRASRGQSRSLPGEDFYFKPGITYSYIGTQGFKARLLSPNSIFDIASSSVFTTEELRMYMLGFLNSSLVRFLMGVLNPTINFQIGDLRKIPFALPDLSTQIAIGRLAFEAVELVRSIESAIDERAGCRAPDDEYRSAKAKESSIQKEIDTMIFELYKVSSDIQKQIVVDPWVVRGQQEILMKPGARKHPVSK